MVALLIIAVFQAILLVLLLVTKHPKTKADHWLGFYLGISAFTILLAYLEMWNRNNGYPFPWLINLSTPFILLIGPSLWIYIKSLTQQRFRFKPLYLLTAIPFAIIAFLLVLQSYTKPEAIKISLEETGELKQSFVFIFTVGLIACSNIGYTIWSLGLIARYKKKLKTFFAKTDEIDLFWIRFLLLSALVSYASISMLYAFDAMFNVFKYSHLQLIGFSIASAFVVAIGFVGLKQGNIFTSQLAKFDVESAINIGENTSPLTNSEEEFVNSLLNHMKENKPFTDPEIMLSKLSNDLGVTPEYLSGIINGRLNKNFFDFINHFRIQEFKSLCQDPKNRRLTLISLAYDSGFNSKATFNRVFKSVMGCTPSDYLKRVST